MTNVQTVILSTVILVAALLINRAPEAQTATDSKPVAVVPRASLGFAWFVVRDEIWYCDQGKCKKAMQP